MSWLSKATGALGITPSEIAQIGAAYATGGFSAAAGATIGSLGQERAPTPMTTFPTQPRPGVMMGTEQGQSVAISQATQTRPQETQASGETIGIPAPGTAPTYQAGFGIVPGVSALAKKYVPQIVGGLGTGAVVASAPVVMDMFGQPKRLRVTRKLKSQVRQAVDLVGIEGAAQAMGVDVNTVMYILTKKMRNDGPYVTKAAVRKTRQTVRKMKNLCDMYDDLRPAAKRRAPARRAMAGTRITQVK